MPSKIEFLIDRLCRVASDGELAFSGEVPREFFTEMYDENPGVILSDHLPDSHDDSWETEWAKNPHDVDKLMLDRRAIAFMSSGRGGVHRQYKENELRAFVYGRSRMIRRHNFLRQAKTFATMPAHREEDEG